jgi:GTPase
VLGVQRQGVTDDTFEASLRELARLADTLGMDVIAQVTQRRGALASGTVVGAGKLKELAKHTGGKGVVPGYVRPGRGSEDDDADTVSEPDTDEAAPEAEAKPEPATVVIVDHELSPSQTRNLEKATGAEVLDRPMVILSIFLRHARTREARMQVEIARLSYMAPRLRETGGGGDRQGGKGAGESAVELDRRKIRDRIAQLREELEVVKRESDTRRQRRSTGDTPTVALVGYTNAGKSSLMRALTGDEVYVADQLFATLDTTVRVLQPATQPRVLVSDTVGFIKQLPHDLVASFRSTLEEAKEAGLLLHVVDAADPALRDQLRVTHDVLADIGAGDRPTLLVLNKIDCVDAAQQASLRTEFPEAFLMSARNADDIARLHAHIVAFFEQDMKEVELVVGYDRQKLVAQIHETARVLEERYEADGTHLRVRAPKAAIAKLRADLRSRK